MALIIWNTAYSVGVDVLDADHIMIASLINHMDDAKQSGTDEAAINSILHTLIMQAHDHFRREEALMAAANYPQLDRHIREHRVVEDQLTELYDEYRRTPDPDISQEFMELLNFWLIEHILKVDKHYEPFLRAVQSNS